MLAYADEIRFGPPHFRLWITDEPHHRAWWWLGSRSSFGEHCRFSADSCFLVAERWHAFLPAKPDIAFVAFELDRGLVRSVGARARTVADVEARFASIRDEARSRRR